jgi:hypothetical protein
MTEVNKKWLRDAGERIFWTAAQTVVGVAIIELTNISSDKSIWWAALIIPALTTAKTALAKKIGSDSAAIGGPQG